MVLFIIIIVIAAVVYFILNKNMIKSHEETQRELAAKLTGNNDNSTDDLIESLRIETARIEAYIQAEMVGDKKDRRSHQVGNIRRAIARKTQ